MIPAAVLFVAIYFTIVLVTQIVKVCCHSALMAAGLTTDPVGIRFFVMLLPAIAWSLFFWLLYS